MKKIFSLLTAAAFALSGCRMITIAEETPVVPATDVPEETAVVPATDVPEETEAVPAVNPAFIMPETREEMMKEISEIEKILGDLRTKQGELTAKRDFLRAQQDAKLFEANAEIERLQKEAALREKQTAREIADWEAERIRLETRLALERSRDTALTTSKNFELSDIERSKKEVEVARRELEVYRVAPVALAKKRQELEKTVSQAAPVYAENPFDEATGTLKISDRRIDLNGPLTPEAVKSVAEQIAFYNMRDEKLPLFVVITTCPGGSVRSGLYLKSAIESSEAPVYVVVKGATGGVASFVVATAENSFAYGNAMITQSEAFAKFNDLSKVMYLREDLQLVEYWVKKLATPIAEKMGLTYEQFREKIYQKNSLGDWSEPAVQAQKLGWVNKIVSRIEESSVTALAPVPAAAPQPQQPRPEEKPKSQFDLPLLLDPTDYWWMHDPNGVYNY